jgi:hypothetical protein
MPTEQEVGVDIFVLFHGTPYPVEDISEGRA